MRPTFMLALLLVPALALAGCTKDEGSPAERTFTASGGKASLGWAYDGASVQAASATLEGRTVNAENTGNVSATFELAGSTWTILFDQFSQASGKDFQDGGIAFDLDEHGDTGVADASIPKIHALVAAWGTARVTRDGALATPEPWTAHLMVSQDTVRGADGKITKADGTTPYDPNAPADARRVEGDPQALLFVKHPQGETFSRAPVNLTAALACQGPQCAQTAELAIEPGATQLDLNLTVFGPDASLPLGPVGQGRVALLDADGNELGGVDVAPSPQGGPPASLSVPLQGVTLPLSLSLTGAGVFNVAAAGTATYSDVPFIVLTWDEVTIS